MTKQFFLLALALGASLFAAAQIFPVTVNQTLNQVPEGLAGLPLSPQSQWSVGLQLQDPKESSVQVILRLRIEGAEARIVTRPEAPPVIHTVPFGQQLVLRGADLEYLVNPGNLDFSGVGREAFFANGGRLPEGFYTFCVEAYLLNRPDQAGVSNESCVPIVKSVLEPPVVTYPLEGQTVPTFLPQNFAINWQTNNPGAVEQYELSLTPYGEAVPGPLSFDRDGTPPNAVAGNGAPFANILGTDYRTPGASFFGEPDGFGFSTGLPSPMVPTGASLDRTAPLFSERDLTGLSRVIGPAEPPLVQGQTYILRVRAYDPLGGKAYRNGGWSLPVTFTYGETCAAVQGINALPVADTRVQLTWMANPAAVNGYRVFLRNRSLPEALTRWYEVETTLPALLLDRLLPNTRYEYAVSATCAGGPGPGAGGFFYTPRPPNVNGDVADTGGEGGTPAAPPTAPGVFTLEEGGDPYNPTVQACTDDPGVGQSAVGAADGSVTLAAGESFRLAGLDVRAVKLSPGGGDSFSGQGTLLIPWLEQGAIAVDFANVRLDGQRRLVAGSVTALRGKQKIDVSAFKTLLGDEEACGNYTERQLDDRGFGADGVHYLTGSKLDPRGFDQQGNYHGATYAANPGTTRDPRGFDAGGLHLNGSPYDDNGCNRDSLNRYGQPCVWRGGNGTAPSGAGQPRGQREGTASPTGTSSNAAITPSGPTTPGPATVEGTAFHADKGTAYWETHTAAAVDTMLARTNAGISVFSFLAGAGRTFISGYMFATGLDKALLVGDNEELLQAGMSARFPNGLPSVDTTGRETRYLLYDAMIRELYETDRYIEDTLKALRATYEQHQSNPALGNLTNHVVNHVKALSATELATLEASETALFNWIRERVALKVLQLSQAPGAGYGAWFNPGAEDLFRGGPGGPAYAALGGEATEYGTTDLKDYLKRLKSVDYDRQLGFKLPIKIEREILGKTYAVYIDELTLAADGLTVDAFTILPLPGKDGDHVVFKGEDLAITENGVVGNPKLSLVSQLDIGAGSYGTFTFPASADNFVTFDCGGYQSFELTGEMLFCRDKVVPLNDDGTLKEAASGQAADKAPRVTASLNLQGTDWLNFLTEVEVKDKFAVRSLRDVWWKADGRVIIDFSEDTSSVNMVLPEGYVSNYVGSGRKPTPRWEGVYLPSLDATVDVFEKRSAAEKMGFRTENLIIDDTGITVHASARDVLTLDEGKVGNWAVGVDSVDLHLFQNAWKSALLRGAVRLPTGKQDTLGYLAQASEDGAFSFGVSIASPRELSWDAWDGKMTVMPNSSLTIGRDDSEGWFAQTRLYGKMELGIEPSARFTAPDVVFDDFRLATRSPHVSLGENGRFGITNAAVKVKGFGLEIEEFSLIDPGKHPQTQAERLGLRVKGKLSLMGGSGGFGVAGGVDVVGAYDTSNPAEERLVYDTTKVNDMFLSVKAPGLFIAGGIKFFDESVGNGAYGSGFQGLIDARFDGVGVGVSAAGMFGSMPPDRGDYRYWFVDAGLLLQMPTASVPIVGVLHLTGIGGGASYHMTRSDNPNKPVEVTFGAKPTAMPPLGQTLSGLTLTPDKGTGLGLRLMTSIATFPSPTVMNGGLLLGAEFTSSWGLNKLYFAGSASIASPTKPDGTPLPGANPTVAVGFDIQYLHRQRQLSGGLHSWVNYPPSPVPTILQGRQGKFAGKDGYVGQIELFVSPSDTYVWAGRPYRRGQADQRLGLKLLKPLTIDVNGYFALGNKLPPPAQIASQVLNQLRSGINDFDESAYDLPLANSGLAFGAELSIPKINKTAEIPLAPDINYSIGMLAGFNVQMTTDAYCNGAPAGLNGFFAAGNAYLDAYVAVNSFRAGVTAAGTVSGPNPFYAAGAFTVDVSGLPNFSADGSYGTPCKNQSSVKPPPVAFKLPFADNELIVATSLQADDRLGAGETFTYTLADEVDRSFFIADGNGQREFRLHVGSANITVSSHTPVVTLGGNTITVAPPAGGWKPDRQDQATIQVKLQEKVNGNWNDFSFGGKAYVHRRTDGFTTEPAPTFDILTVHSPLDGAEDVPVNVPILYNTDLRKLTEYVAEVYPNGSVAPVAVSIALRDSLGNPVVLRDRTGPSGGRLPGMEPADALNSGMRYTLTASYAARIRLGGREETLRIDGKDHREEKVVTFTTAPRARQLGAEHLVRAYPEALQYNVYREQTTEDCFAVFADDLTALLGPAWMNAQTQGVFVRYRDNVTDAIVWRDGATVDGNTLSWAALPQVLQGDKTYRVELYVDRPDASRDGNRTPAVGNIGRAGTAPGGRSFADGEVFYVGHFRVSTFPSFAAKINDIGWAAGQQRQRQGVMSPTYWDRPVTDDYGQRPIPYQADLTARPLGYVGYREAVGLTELFSREELEGRLAIEVQQNGYYDELERDFFNWQQQYQIAMCDEAQAENAIGIGATVRDEIPRDAIYLVQGIPGPQLSPQSGHGIGTEPLLADPRTEVFAGQSGSGLAPHGELDGRTPGVYYTDAGLTSQAPLVLVNDLHRRAVEQYNNSWLFRASYRQGDCDFADPNLAQEAERQLEDHLNAGNITQIVEEVNDAILAGELAGQLGAEGFGNPLVDGQNPIGLPATTTQPVGELASNTELVIQNGGGGATLQVSAYGQPVYGADNYSDGRNDGVDQNINTYGSGPWMGGYTDHERYRQRLDKIFLLGQNPFPTQLPSPVGRSMPVRIVYRIPLLEGGFREFSSAVIDTKF